MGGSFGAKTFVRLEALVAALARKAGRPVKAVLDRAEEFVTLNRHPAAMRVRIGARRDGTLVAKEVDCWVDTGAYADCGPGVATKIGYAGVGPYRIPHVRGRLAGDLHEPAAQRRLPRLRRDAVGVGVRAHDGPARRASSDMSPLELRRMNLLRDGDVLRHRRGHARRALRGVPAGRRRRGRLRGRPARQGPVRAAQGHADAEPRRDRASSARRSATSSARASCEMGQGVRRSIQLMAAELLGCEPGQVEVPDPDTDTSPFDTRTTSSRSTHMMGRALARGGRATCAPTAASAASARSQRGRPRSRHRPGHRLDALAPGRRGRARVASTRRPAASDRRAPARRRSTRAASSTAPGAELQNEGSMIMGLGTALFEAIEFADGQVANANLSDYNVPALGDLPRAHARADRARRRRGARAGGDRAAAGARRRSATRSPRSASHVTELPITAERVLEARRTGGEGRTLILNGRAADARGAHATRCCSPVLRRDGPAVGARDVRDRRLRRLHRAARRRAGVRLPDARRAGRRARGHDRRGARRGDPVAARVRRGARLPVRLVHAGLRARRASGCSRRTRAERRRDRRGARRQPVPLRLAT